ncbi:kinase-like protein [Rhizophagus irregularis]|uniref:Kinase-like protein n=1 Tax=Rhizophagus irregularis TaxID=588596 RepID=A0A2N0NRL4_9GLOM|nr:kinase-like protein [Rhizophagus irregularis]
MFIHHEKYPEWILFEKFQNFTYIAEGGFSKIYTAEWSEGLYLKIKNGLKLLFRFVFMRLFVTQDPNTKEYMMVLFYCKDGNLRNYLNNSKNYIDCGADIHNAGFIHKDFHSVIYYLSPWCTQFICDCIFEYQYSPDFHPFFVHITSGFRPVFGFLFFLFKFNCVHHFENGDNRWPIISDLGMCQSANKQTVKEEGIYGVLPYMAPEILCGYQYTKAADIYSFGIIIMNEFLSKEIPFNDIPHDVLYVKIY